MQKTSDNYGSWAILGDMLAKEGVARQHLNSYSEFVERGLQSIIDEVGGIDIETTSTPYRVKFGKLTRGKPRVVEIDGSVSGILPLEGRLRNLTYATPMYLEMTIQESGVEKERQNQHIGDLPMMVKSDPCPLGSWRSLLLAPSAQEFATAPQLPPSHGCVSRPIFDRC